MGPRRRGLATAFLPSGFQKAGRQSHTMSQGTRRPRAKAALAAAVGTSPGSPGHRSERPAEAGGRFGQGAGEGHVAAQEHLASQSQETCGAQNGMGSRSIQGTGTRHRPAGLRPGLQHSVSINSLSIRSFHSVLNAMEPWWRRGRGDGRTGRGGICVG